MTTRPSTRSAFTLVELLIVMTVIGILVGMLAAAVIPAFSRANEFTIQAEIMQMEASVERFKTKYGFYPPSFAKMNGPADLLPYLNRIAPNHAEGNGSDGNGLELWWDEVGLEIQKSVNNSANNNNWNVKTHSGADLVFWLSGLAKNKQYPLTGSAGATTGWLAFNGDNIEREIFYDFRPDQIDQPSYQNTPMSTNGNSDSVRRYLQPKGKGDTPYLYLDSASYASNQTAPYTEGGEAFNPKTFQLVSAGMDGEFGDFGEVNGVGALGTDNITNFAEGRLERIILGTK